MNSNTSILMSTFWSNHASYSSCTPASPQVLGQRRTERRAAPEANERRSYLNGDFLAFPFGLERGVFELKELVAVAGAGRTQNVTVHDHERLCTDGEPKVSGWRRREQSEIFVQRTEKMGRASTTARIGNTTSHARARASHNQPKAPELPQQVIRYTRKAGTATIRPSTTASGNFWYARISVTGGSGRPLRAAHASWGQRAARGHGQNESCLLPPRGASLFRLLTVRHRQRSPVVAHTRRKTGQASRTRTEVQTLLIRRVEFNVFSRAHVSIVFWFLIR
jgi:hypothetical protein